MEQETYMRLAIGRADLGELLAKSFSYPDGMLIQAIIDGSYHADWLACLSDAGADSESLACAEKLLAELPREDSGALLATCRQEYSRLYLTPGKSIPIYPYESAFLAQEKGSQETPTLFRSTLSLDVEKQMREAGVKSVDGAREPSDSIFRELEFTSYLYARKASASQESNPDEIDAWAHRLYIFLDTHILGWVPSFFEKTVLVSQSPLYRAFASLGLLAMDCYMQELLDKEQDYHL